MLLAIPIGVYSAMRPGSFVDRFGMVVILIGVAAHPLWLGYMLTYFLSFRLGYFPLAGYCDFMPAPNRCSGPGPWAYHLLLPWLTLGLGVAALYARMVRAATMEALHEDFVRTGRAKGLGEWAVVRRHVVPNALLPIVTMVAMDAALLFGSAVFVERVFNLPGLGSLLVTSLRGRDLPVILGVTLVDLVRDHAPDADRRRRLRPRRPAHPHGVGRPDQQADPLSPAVHGANASAK